MIYTQKQRNLTQSSELVKLPYELPWNLSSKELQLQFSYPQSISGTKQKTDGN
jgi:hypothetical protein